MLDRCSYLSSISRLQCRSSYVVSLSIVVGVLGLVKPLEIVFEVPAVCYDKIDQLPSTDLFMQNNLHCFVNFVISTGLSVE